MRAHSRIAILVLAGAMLLAACGGDDPDTTVYRDADNRSLFKLPNDWNLYRADELFCTGTMGELTPVIELDGRTIGTGDGGPFTQRLSQLYAELTRSSGFPILVD